MTDPIATHAAHWEAIRREELRQLDAPPERYFDTPHLVVAAAVAVYAVPTLGSWADVGFAGASATHGPEPFPAAAGDAFLLPAGAWTARLDLHGSATAVGGVGWRRRIRLRLAADPGGVAAESPWHEFFHDAVPTYDGQAGDMVAGELHAQIEAPPLVSDGTLLVWVSLAAFPLPADVTLTTTTQLVFGRIA